MITINRKLGYVKISFFKIFAVMYCWDWCGNLYRENRVLRFDTGWWSGVHRMKITYTKRYGGEETLYIYRWLQPWRWNWNSEFIARKWGKHIESTWENPGVPDHYVYNGWLGHHIYL